MVVDHHSVIEPGERCDLCILVHRSQRAHALESLVADLPGESGDGRAVLSKDELELLCECGPSSLRTEVVVQIIVVGWRRGVVSSERRGASKQLKTY